MSNGAETNCRIAHILDTLLMISYSVPFLFRQHHSCRYSCNFQVQFLKYSEAHKIYRIFDILVFKSYLLSGEMFDNLIYPVNLSVPQLTFEGDVMHYDVLQKTGLVGNLSARITAKPSP